MPSNATPTVTPAVRTVFQAKLHPSPRQEQVITKVLSITESSVSPIAGPECIWFYDKPSEQLPGLLAPNLVRRSLQSTLAAYPFFAGRLQQIPFRADGDWTERQGRFRVIYGGDDDPGIQFAVAECNQPLAEIIPAKTHRDRVQGVWESGQVPFTLFQGEGDLPMCLDDGFMVRDDLSVMRVKITTFTCGGVAVAAKIVHPLCDAEALAGFMRHWSSIHVRHYHDAGTNGDGCTQWKPIFDPEGFMTYAAGDINAPSADSELQAVSRRLPLHRYDWWASADGCPQQFLWRTKIAPEVKVSNAVLPPLNNPIPWEKLDEASPISPFTVSFSREEVEGMYRAATAGGKKLQVNGTASSRISHLDALMAHIWALLIRARQLPKTDAVFANMAINFRSRVDPPLPKAYVGCAGTLCYAASTAEAAAVENTTRPDSGADLSRLAGAIRTSIAALNPDTIPALLHDWSHNVECRRYWGTFIGKHHLTATSWLHNGLNDVDFGGGQAPRWVEPIMPPYLACIREGEASAQTTSDVEAIKDQTRIQARCDYKPWYTNGAIVSLHFESEVMARLIQDPDLRRFDVGVS